MQLFMVIFRKRLGCMRVLCILFFFAFFEKKRKIIMQSISLRMKLSSVCVRSFEDISRTRLIDSNFLNYNNVIIIDFIFELKN